MFLSGTFTYIISEQPKRKNAWIIITDSVIEQR